MMLLEFLFEGKDHGLIVLVVLEKVIIIELPNMALKFVVVRLQKLPH
jgi:hypothetical protein